MRLPDRDVTQVLDHPRYRTCHKSGDIFKACLGSEFPHHDGSNHSSGTLVEDGAVYSVERSPKPLLGQPSISGSSTQP